MFRVARREDLAERVFAWEVAAPLVARAARAGQFVMVREGVQGERIPLTLADWDAGAGTITLVIQAVGRSTEHMRRAVQAGGSLDDLVGPLGRPAEIARVGRVTLVGGGLGVAPLHPLVRAMKQAGNEVRVILGFRSAAQVFWVERFRRWCDDLVLCTDDGSAGRAGLVTAPLAEAPADLVVAVGPLRMMRACAELGRERGIPTRVSLDTIMVDGTGMCGSCRVSVDGQVRFACVDGPEFDGHRVDFAELETRARRFHDEEARAKADFEHVCQLEQALFVDGRRNYKKLKELQPQQVPAPERDPATRSLCFDEVSLGYSLGDALVEAERCIQCSNPACVSGCPVQIDIPRFLRHLLVRDLDGAADVIHEASLFPSICGRVCPQETQCEAQCIVGKKLEPVAIGRLERFVGDHARGRPPKLPAERRHRVAVCGSGPAGLACAADLARGGCEVVVYEALHVTGGVLRYGIPAFRLPRDILDREIARVEALGVRFETNVLVGHTLGVGQLLAEHDAVFIGVGAGAPAMLGIPGESAGRVYSANELLTRVNLMGGDRFPFADTPVAIGQSVIVVGAGNTAMDCLRVVRRLGAGTVRCVYRRSEAEAPARREELRHAKEEGVEFLFLHAPVEVRVEDGEVRGMRVERMRLGEPDARGRRSPVGTGEFVELSCDTVVTALGTRPNPVLPRATPELRLDARGNIVADPLTQATSIPGVYAGGDIVTGGATVILAMGAGRRAARAILAWLARREEAPATEPEAREGSCPRCHQPLDGDEAYVCCADAVLTWRCSGCGKVSDGFAFPWGACPLCGGRLLAAGPTAGDVGAVRTAFEIELGGLGFYRQAAASATPEMRPFFERMAAMEEEHLATLARRYHARPEAGPVSLDRAALFGGIDSDPADPENLFRLAIAFEERAVRLFEAGGDRPLYQELAAEEREHVALLRGELARLRQGRRGIL